MLESWGAEMEEERMVELDKVVYPHTDEGRRVIRMDSCIFFWMRGLNQKKNICIYIYFFKKKAVTSLCKLE